MGALGSTRNRKTVEKKSSQTAKKIKSNPAKPSNPIKFHIPVTKP